MTMTRMTDAETEAVNELLQSSYTWLGEREGLTDAQTDFLVSQRGSLEHVRNESQAQSYLVARDGARIVGVVAVSGEMVTKLYVGPEHMGKGVGRLLYEAAESAIRAGGHTRVKLGAFPTAVPFYERMGLEVVSHRTPAGALAGLNMAMMEKHLD
ncbi:MAG: GNAT family N-acetyltransferase [Candidatus Eisenbacteria bacterium]